MDKPTGLLVSIDAVSSFFAPMIVCWDGFQALVS